MSYCEAGQGPRASARAELAEHHLLSWPEGHKKHRGPEAGIWLAGWEGRSEGEAGAHRTTVRNYSGFY